MVDREARDKAAELLQQLKDGLITSSQFAETWPGENEDAAFSAVLEAFGDSLFALGSAAPQSPQEPGAKSQEPALNADGEALFERCALFLKSDLELDPQAPCPVPPQPRRGPLRAAASLVLIGGVAVAFLLWGLSSRTAGLLMLWGLVWTLLYHLAEHAVCRPPEGWSIGTVFWPFTSQSDYERQLKHGDGNPKRQIPNPNETDKT